MGTNITEVRRLLIVAIALHGNWEVHDFLQPGRRGSENSEWNYLVIYSLNILAANFRLLSYLKMDWIRNRNRFLGIIILTWTTDLRSRRQLELPTNYRTQKKRCQEFPDWLYIADSALIKSHYYSDFQISILRSGN